MCVCVCVCVCTGEEVVCEDSDCEATHNRRELINSQYLLDHNTLTLTHSHTHTHTHTSPTPTHTTLTRRFCSW